MSDHAKGCFLQDSAAAATASADSSLPKQQQQRSAPDAGQLRALWTTVVEGALLGSSHERKSLALQLFQLVLPYLTQETVPVVFSPLLLRCLVSSLKDKSSYLNASAKRCVVSGRYPQAVGSGSGCSGSFCIGSILVQSTLSY